MGFRITLQRARFVKNEVTSCDDSVTTGMGSRGVGENLGCMSVPSVDTVVLRRGELQVEVVPRPFALTIRRGRRRLVRSLGAWVADGTVHDHFIQLTEGVVAHEDLAPVERAVSASVETSSEDRLT